MNAIAQIRQEDAPGAIIEQVIVKGDLSKLTPEERTRYYMEVCRSVGLNPMTKPFEYITLNGKLTLYALRACTDQLRGVHGVSVEDLAETERDGVFIVTAKVRNKEGRTDIAKGAVTINNLKGDALANAMMKAETKAKRRATLSLCGLGWLDESELDTIPASAKGPAQPSTNNPISISPPAIEAPHDPETGEVSPHTIVVPKKGEKFDWVGWGAKLVGAYKSATFPGELVEWKDKNKIALASCSADNKKAFDRIEENYKTCMATLSQAPVTDAEVVMEDDSDLPPALRQPPQDDLEIPDFLLRS